MAAKDSDQSLGTAVSAVAERVQLLVREEIELAQAEITAKATKLIAGVVIGAAAGLFAVVGILFLLAACAWLFYDYVFDQIAFGFLILAGVLFLAAAGAGFAAFKAIMRTKVPKPEMAIAEAHKIRDTVSAKGASGSGS